MAKKRIQKKPAKPKSPPPIGRWSKARKEVLLATPDMKLKQVFPAYSIRTLIKWKQELRAQAPQQPAFDDEAAKAVKRAEKSRTQAAIREATKRIEDLERANRKLIKLASHQEVTPIRAGKASSVRNHATAVIMGSDQHYDEPVNPEKVNGLNEYNPHIAKDRFQRFTQNAVKLCNLAQHQSDLDAAILWLGGDSFSGAIHDDTAIGACMRPLEAALDVLAIYRGMIDYLRDNLQAKTKLKVVFSFGNHGRTTKKPMKLLAREHNLEWFMANIIAREYATRPGVEVTVPDAYHTYVDVYGFVIRFHHGDNVQYGGGIGGLTIPLNKKIAQWNRGRHADLDVLGHFHQYFDGGNFVVNGSLIGYNPYAISIGAAYEPPRQAFFVIDENRGKTISTPIFVDEVRGNK